MRKPTLLMLALLGTATLTLGTPNRGCAGGATLPIIGKLPIPVPPSVPGVPQLPGGIPGTPQLPALPSGLGGVVPSTSTLTGLPSLAPELVTQNVAYLQKPGLLSPTKAAALLQEISTTLLPL